MDAPLSSRPRMSEEDFRAYGRKLTELAEWMADYGVPMTYHHHMGTVVETQREIDLLMANTGKAVGLLLDTRHLAFAGGDIVETTRKHGRRINHVHCKDLRWDVLKTVRQKDQSFLSGVLDGVFTVPGDGFIDFHAFARALASKSGAAPRACSTPPRPSGQGIVASARVTRPGAPMQVTESLRA